MKLALPKGRLLGPSRALLQAAGFDLAGYDEKSRSYRPACPTFPELQVKVFQEKDIPVQVAVGNYDLGICGLDWVDELLAKYAGSTLVKVFDLGYGERRLCAASGRGSAISSLEELVRYPGIVRIASEYANLAESFALGLRLKRFKVFPLWGAAEAYPPESAEVIITLQESVDARQGLLPLVTMLDSSAFLIANRRSWESQDLTCLIEPLCSVRIADAKGAAAAKPPAEWAGLTSEFSSAPLRLALPDGHQQEPMLEFLAKAGIGVKDYNSLSRRPQISLDGVAAKVIRPQDMPLQVANGNFDLAITGRDWLLNHLYRFPTSPVRELLNLGFGWVRLVAVVTEDTPVSSVRELRAMPRTAPLRVASEYVSIADKYARDNHLSPCRLIPTWGASEAFLPEDADLLIENTQTGRTLAQHHLKIIDTLFESTACLIGRPNGANRDRIASVVEAFRRGL